MKTRIIIIALAAITLLSFTVVSSKKMTSDKAQSKATNEGAFALQDKDQF